MTVKVLWPGITITINLCISTLWRCLAQWHKSRCYGCWFHTNFTNTRVNKFANASSSNANPLHDWMCYVCQRRQIVLCRSWFHKRSVVNKNWRRTWSIMKDIVVEHGSFDVSNPYEAWSRVAFWFGFRLGCLESLLRSVLIPTQSLINQF